MSTSFNALECKFGAATMLVATESIEALGEYSVGSPLPLTERMSFAVGSWVEQMVLSINMSPTPSGASRQTAGLLLVTPGTSIRWALEITEPLGILEVTGVTRGPSTASTPWLKTASLSDGRTMQIVDVKEMIAKATTGVAQR
jgi:hypothetical protein